MGAAGVSTRCQTKGFVAVDTSRFMDVIRKANVSPRRGPRDAAYAHGVRSVEPPGFGDCGLLRSLTEGRGLLTISYSVASERNDMVRPHNQSPPSRS